MYTPERIKSARVMMGMSLDELSDKIPYKISKQAINKYEKGLAITPRKFISELSKISGLVESWFQLPPYDLKLNFDWEQVKLCSKHLNNLRM